MTCEKGCFCFYFTEFPKISSIYWLIVNDCYAAIRCARNALSNLSRWKSNQFLRIESKHLLTPEAKYVKLSLLGVCCCRQQNQVVLLSSHPTPPSPDQASGIRDQTQVLENQWKWCWKWLRAAKNTEPQESNTQYFGHINSLRLVLIPIEG